MKRRTFQTIIFALFVIPIGGCEMTPDQQLQAIDRAVTYLQAESGKLDRRLAVVDTLIAKTEQALADPNLAGSISSEVLAALQQAREEKPRLLAAKAKIDIVLADLKANCEQLKAGGPVDTAALLRLAAQTLSGAGTAIGGPVGGWMQLVAMVVLGLFGAGGAGTAVMKSRLLTVTRDELQEAKTEVREKDTALTEVVEGGEQWKLAVKKGLPEGTDALAAWKQAMKGAQVSEVTKQQVALTRAMIELPSLRNR